MFSGFRCQSVGLIDHACAHSQQPSFRAQLQNGRSGIQLLAVHEFKRMCDQGNLDGALDILGQMDNQGVAPSVSMFKSLLKVCATRRSLNDAKQVQSHLTKHRFDFTRFLGESLVSTLVKCGGLEDALYVLHKMPHQPVSSWTAVLSAYTMHGEHQSAVRLYELMLEKRVKPNASTFVSVLKACGNIADLELGKSIHAEVVKHECESDSFVRSCLVDMYRRCGSIVDAEKVFGTVLQQLDLVTCNAMLSAYAQEGQAQQALQLFDRMRKEGRDPDARSFVSLLQACGMQAETERLLVGGERSISQKHLEIGKVVHAAARAEGYDSDVFVGNTLISMYGKCGSLDDAEIVFQQMLSRNVVSWNAMLTAYIQHGQAELALQLYDKMCQQGVSRDARTFVSAFRACGMVAERNIANGQILMPSIIDRGRALHVDARKKGYDADVFVGNTLISMYGKCGSIMDAQEVFYSMPCHDLVSWNAMLAVYTQHGKAENALQLYEKMLQKRFCPDVRTMVYALQACGMIAEDKKCSSNDANMSVLERGKAIHENARRKGYDTDVFLGTTLITMYWKCGSIVDAQEVFNGLTLRNVVAWNAMLTAYVQQGQADMTLDLYEQLLDSGVSADDCTLLNALQSCALLAEKEQIILVGGQSVKANSYIKGKALHADVWRRGFQSDVLVCGAMVNMYAKCGSIVDAQNVFDGSMQRNTVLCNVMLTAYTQQGKPMCALQLYEKMQNDGWSPDVRTFVSTLHACGSLAEIENNVTEGLPSKVTWHQIAKAVHADALRRSYDKDVFVSNTLISVYGKCGSTLDAKNVFDGLRWRDVVSWNAMAAAYVEHGLAENCLDLYEQMQTEGVSPDRWTFVGLLQAAALLAQKEDEVLVNGQSIKAKSLERVKALHADSWRRGYHEDTYIGNTLVSVYGKCGSIMDAEEVFDELSELNVVSWNALLAAYSQQGDTEKAFQLYGEMQAEGIHSDEITLVCLIQSCSNAGRLDALRQIHCSLVSTGDIVIPVLVNTLIHAYGKCASMVDARKVFDELVLPDVVSWNALLAGFSRQGNYAMTLELYEDMQRARVKPNGVTFLLLLAACSHVGLLDKGVEFFESMSQDHRITPQVEHYASMVDLFGRAGYFTEVKDLLSKMPVEPDLGVWLSLLGSCRNHGKITLGETAFQNALQMDPKHPAAYVLMSNMYAHVGHWGRARAVKALKDMESAGKTPGKSWIEKNQEVFFFTAGDSKHPLEEQLYEWVGKVSSELKNWHIQHNTKLTRSAV